MNTLFEPVRIKNLELRNRFVRSATFEGCGDAEGNPTDRLITLYEELGRGGVGLVITGIVIVHPSGQISPIQASLAHDDRIPGWRRVTRAVNAHGAAVAAQLFHGGMEAARFLHARGETALAPSRITHPLFPAAHRAMTEKEVWKLAHAFGDAAVRAREAGFDAVQLHGAHGYLLSQFLSPLTNQRSDRWGGDLKGRLAFHRAVYDDMRARAGADFPILIKLGVKDEVEGGMSLDEGQAAARILADMGFDALEISQGLRGTDYEDTEFRTRILSPDREAYFRTWCRDIQREVNPPTMMVGGLRSLDMMEEVVNAGEADFISLSRPLIREPDLIGHWARGDRQRPACISCNKCLEALRMGTPVHCVMKSRKNASILP